MTLPAIRQSSHHAHSKPPTSRYRFTEEESGETNLNRSLDPIPISKREKLTGPEEESGDMKLV